MNTEINPGDKVTYYPKQADKENLHFPATVVARAKRHNFFRIKLDGMRARAVHRKHLVVGQIDAFENQSVG